MSTKSSSRQSARVVLGFDIGTAYSGISYSILDPRVPGHETVKRVNNFDAQEDSSSTRTPSLIYYNSQGAWRSAGDAALTRGIERQAAERAWIKVERFKLYMHDGESSSLRLPDLPPSLSVVDMLSDYLEYLHDTAQTFIKAQHDIDLDDLKGRIHYVLPLPNGWDNLQQQQVRRAAALAGLIETERSPELILITDGEAVLHYCAHRPDFVFPEEDGVIIVSTGAAITNFSGYCKTSDRRLFREIIAAQSALCGSSLITDEAQAFVRYWFRDCRFSDDAEFVAERFDKTTKLQFDDDQMTYEIPFASPRDNDPDLRVRGGMLEFDGQQIAGFFEQNVNRIISSISEIRNLLNGLKAIRSIVLVGGFGESIWLFNQIKSEFGDCDIYRPENDGLNAVADGAIQFYLYHYIKSRITRYTYGVRSSIQFDESNPEHRLRASSKQEQHDGRMVLPNAFDIILPKNTEVHEAKEYKRRYHIKSLNRQGLYKRSVQLLCYRGSLQNPKWTDLEPDLFQPVEVVEADMSTVAKSLTPLKGPGNTPYFALKHDVILSFGASGISARTEVKAQIGWSVTKRFRTQPKTLNVPLHESYGSQSVRFVD
ncbi:hypothetical protein APHAL10511_005116 [Amanita phalloides]|nr:hypothetical protein APHAL10511_005116 [Amanita phalloides]